MKLNSLIETSKALCKIKTKNNSGTGFFVKIIILRKEPKYMLVTTKEIIPLSLIDEKETIEITTEKEKIKQNIKLDFVNRLIMTFFDYNVVAIEILPEDKLKDKVKFLVFQHKYRMKMNNDYINKNIIIMHYPNGQDVECNNGKIISDETSEFCHNLDTNKNSEGSPILIIDDSFKNPVIIGMQTSKIKDNKYNIGVYIDKLILEVDGGMFYWFNMETIPFDAIPNEAIRVVNLKILNEEYKEE